MSDRAGVVGVGMQFAVWEPTRPKTEVSLDVLRDAVFAPLLRAAVAILLDDEFYGRVMFELRVAGLDQVFELVHDGESRPPRVSSPREGI